MTGLLHRLGVSFVHRPNSQPDSPGLNNLAFQHVQEEHFVDAAVAAAFLSITRKYLLKLSRVGVIPAHPFGVGSRKQWRYLISELAEWGLSQTAIRPDNDGGSPRAAKRGK
jgi:hypothetical protein